MNSERREPDSEDRLYKIGLVVDLCNNRMTAIFYSGLNLILEKSINLWRAGIVNRWVLNTSHAFDKNVTEIHISE